MKQKQNIEKNKRERRKEEREKEGSIKPAWVLITPELHQELISLHNLVHRVSNTLHL